MIRSIFVTTLTFAYILLVGPWFLLYAMIRGKTDGLYECGRWGAWFSLWLSGIKLDVVGAENILKDRAAVFMPNHESLSDAPAVFVLLPPVVAIAKKEFFKMPVLGRAMTLRGFVALDRKNRERAVRAVEEAAESLKNGHPFLAFPEGTRSLDGRLQRFKKGVFIMAIKAQAPIVPVSISGSRKIMRKGEWSIRSGTIRITFHEPISTEGCTVDDRDAVAERVRRAILSGLTEEEWPLEAAFASDHKPQVL